MEIKFTVIKNDDVVKFLDDKDRSELSRLLWKIEQGRYEEGKEAVNTYLVVNTDEPYATQVTSIMKNYGHWGKEEDSNQLTAVIENGVLVLPDAETRE